MLGVPQLAYREGGLRLSGVHPHAGGLRAVPLSFFPSLQEGVPFSVSSVARGLCSD